MKTVINISEAIASTDIPQDARYGVWDYRAKKFVNFIVSDDEAYETEESCRHSGRFVVFSVRDDVDDSFLREIQ